MPAFTRMAIENNWTGMSVKHLIELINPSVASRVDESGVLSVVKGLKWIAPWEAVEAISHPPCSFRVRDRYEKSMLES